MLMNYCFYYHFQLLCLRVCGGTCVCLSECMLRGTEGRLRVPLPGDESRGRREGEAGAEEGKKGGEEGGSERRVGD